MTPGTISIMIFFLGKVWKETLKSFLGKVKRRLGRGRLGIILDNDFAHHAREVKALARKKGLHLHY